MLLLNFIFQGWPETVTLIFTSFAIVGYKPNLREIIGYSLFLVTMIYLFRIFPMSFGLHTIVAVITLALITYKAAKESLGISFFTAFSTIFLMAFLERGFHLLTKNLIGNVSMDEGWLWILVCWPQIICLAGVAIIIRKFRPILIKKLRWLNEE